MGPLVADLVGAAALLEACIHTLARRKSTQLAASNARLLAGAVPLLAGPVN
jgi:hypothetical protein